MALYSFRHLLIIFTLLSIPILWGLKLKKNKKILKIILISLLFLELFRIFFLIINHHFSINKDLSLQLCYLYPFIGLIYLITNKEYLLNYLGPFGILFSIAAIIFTNPNPFLNFDTIHCYIYHSILLLSGIYITKNYKAKFSLKNIFILLIQIMIAFVVNSLINKSNYIFLNSFLHPNIKYNMNIEAFNIPLFNYSINEVLINLINNLGYFYYTILLLLVITVFSTFWLYIFRKKT